ncbi:MAG: hypothetical protein KIS76_16385 [Pyrinomonadaceae bacterium]|nr:hypothetical protein [Pyrinomonadaceae bacterium]
MKHLFYSAFAVLFLFSISIFAQPRPVDKTVDDRVIEPAPATFEAKYEGGMLGYNKKESGTLKFDDVNNRLVFLGKDKKDVFAISYASMLAVSPASQSVRSTTGAVVSAIPLPGAGLAGMFIKEKRRYLVIQYSDDDVEIRGLTNFKIDNQALLDSVIKTLGEKAEMKKRGDSYYRAKASADDDDDN